MELKRKIIKLHWLFSEQFGIDPLRMLGGLRGVPEFVRDLRAFRKDYKGPLVLNPCFGDRYAEGGITKSEYFWQDLIVARHIFEAQPKKHVDVGSRIDGFVAHVAAFREIEVFDIRPVSAAIPGIVFRQANLMSEESIAVYTENSQGYCDSISCLHAIEHFGLGRYGDPIDPAGHKLGIANMASLLKPGGTFYLSTPIGRARVEFNANRVFDPDTLIQLVEAHGLALKTLTVIGANGEVREVQVSPETLQALAEPTYNLGIFIFSKK